MATIKVKLRKSRVDGNPGSIYYQLCHKGEVRQLLAKIHLQPQYWDTRNECVIESAPDMETAQRLHIRLETCMKKIIRRYAKATSKSIYVFPVITSIKPEEAYKQYETALNYHNRKLKRLSRLVGQELPLTSYVARHTWATVARKHNIPISVISQGMGHNSEKTTNIYLAALENSVIDNANNQLIKHLKVR